MTVFKGIVLTVNGVSLEQLTEEHKQKIKERNTKEIEKIITSYVIKMLQQNKTIEEINKFLEIVAF